jgi:hypothetical protein
VGLVDDVKQGQLVGLKALRDVLAASLEDPATPPHTRAPLARQLQAALREIEALEPAPREPDMIDRFRMQRDERRAAARQEVHGD